jgi:hypothetical protein
MDQSNTMTAEGGEGQQPFEPVKDFMTGLAKAMHVAAATERDRIEHTVAEYAAQNVDKAHARAALEADALRHSADEDINGIETWAAAEIMRIRADALHRSEERRADLDSYLERHAAIIDAEVAGVHVAVADYQATLDQFVDDLGGSVDPSDIARRAESMPTPPDLDLVRAQSRAAAIARIEAMDGASADSGEPSETPSDTATDATGPGVAVMDPGAVGRPDGLALSVDPLQAPDEDPEAAPAAVEAEEPAGGAGRLFRALAPWMTSDATRPETGDQPSH